MWDLSTQVYTRDQQITTGKGIVMARLGSPVRELEVDLLTGLRNVCTQVYTRDQQITTGKGIVMARLRSSVRELEVDLMRFCFEKLGELEMTLSSRTRFLLCTLCIVFCQLLFAVRKLWFSVRELKVDMMRFCFKKLGELEARESSRTPLQLLCAAFRRIRYAECKFELLVALRFRGF